MPTERISIEAHSIWLLLLLAIHWRENIRWQSETWELYIRSKLSWFIDCHLSVLGWKSTRGTSGLTLSSLGLWKRRIAASSLKQPAELAYKKWVTYQPRIVKTPFDFLPSWLYWYKRVQASLSAEAIELSLLQLYIEKYSSVGPVTDPSFWAAGRVDWIFSPISLVVEQVKSKQSLVWISRLARRTSVLCELYPSIFFFYFLYPDAPWMTCSVESIRFTSKSSRPKMRIFHKACRTCRSSTLRLWEILKW